MHKRHIPFNCAPRLSGHWVRTVCLHELLLEASKGVTEENPEMPTEKKQTIFDLEHYSDVIMSAMASKITGILLIYSSCCSGADQRKHQSSGSLRDGNSPVTGGFFAQKANGAEMQALVFNMRVWLIHYNDVIMRAMASQSSTSRLFTQPFRSPVNSPQKGQWRGA